MSVVTLTGFMGTGKTTVGQRLAQRLSKPFIDTDTRIEKLAGVSVAAIFADRGEPYFRTLEKQVIAEVACADAVVATGGGAIVNPENYACLHAAGPIVCLQADAEVIVARTGTDTSRPLLGSGERRARVRQLLAERAPAYALADLTIDTSHCDVETIVNDIVTFLRGYPRRGDEVQP